MRQEPSLPKVFELREWETRPLRGLTLSPADRLLAMRFAEEGEKRLEIDELRDGVRVRTTSWVGVVRLEAAEFRVFPKLARDRLGLVQLLEFASGLEALWRPRAKGSLDLAGTSLLDLVVLLFAEACEEVLRRGLLSGYVEHEEDIPFVRGRILGDRQMLERFGQIDRIFCRFDELEHDVLENQLLDAALRAASRFVSNSSLHRRIARLRSVFEPICDPFGVDVRRAWDDVVYDRLNTHYRRAHDLGRLLVEGLGVEDLLAPGPTRSFAFLLDMNVLFERFVSRLLEKILPTRDYRVDDQRSASFVIWDVRRQETYTRVIPDVMVQHRPSGRSLAIDAKYKLYDERKIDSGDVYQTFLYAYALGSRVEGRLPVSCLLYPASKPETVRTRLRVRTLEAREGAEIIAVGLPIPELLKELASGEGPVTSALGACVRDALVPLRRPILDDSIVAGNEQAATSIN